MKMQLYAKCTGAGWIATCDAELKCWLSDILLRSSLHSNPALCWQEFFFPKEDETTKRQEAWVKAVEPRPTRGHGRKSSSLSVQSDADSSAGHTLALSNPSSSRPGSPEAASSHAEASSGRPPATLVTSSSSGAHLKQSWCQR